MADLSKHESRAKREAATPAAKPIDAWSIVEILLEHWHWLVVSGCLLAFLGWAGGMLAWKKTYMATAQLLRYEPMAAGDFFKPQPLSSDTFANMLKSPQLLQMVSTNLQPPVPAEILNKCVLIKSDSDSDVVKVSIKGYNANWAVNAANIYAKLAVDYMRENQRHDAEEINKTYIQERIIQMDKDINALEKQFRALPQSTLLNAKLLEISGTVTNLTHHLQSPMSSYTGTTRMTEKLASAIDELNSLERKYTDEHPAVIQQKAEIASIQKQIAQSTNAAGPARDQLFNPDYEIIHGKLSALMNSRQLLADRQQEAKSFMEDPPGNVRFFAEATIKNITPDHRWLKVSILTFLGGAVGMAFALGAVFFVEFLETKLKTASDVQRVTRLPVIASLEKLDDKSPSARERWAFRTWTMLQGRLSPSPNHGLVCGITSSQAGEGRSTWVNLLADAASLSGFRVLTISTRPPNGDGTPPHELPDGPHDETNNTSTDLALTSNALACPAEVTEQLTGPNARPSVHIPLPGWVWNLERRKQWLEALEHWRTVENLVILVELPPASVPEAVLLGENLPNMVWLTSSGDADAAETRMQLETLRHARCNMVGAVLNRAPSASLKSRFPRWLGCVAFGCLMSMAVVAQAQKAPTWPTNDTRTTAPTAQPATPAAQPTVSAAQPNTPATEPPTPATQAQEEPTLPSAPAYERPLTNTPSFSITEPSQRAEWQKHLTLGPGDVLSISIYGQPDATRNEVFIGPDGRLSFLEAQNILASGQTIDELRTNLDNELGKYRRAPRVIITPVAYRSKRYYMLGRVNQRGVFVLDRPITVVEAVARAHGFQMGVAGRTSLDLADLQHCFLMRHGKRIPLDFEKLFLHGDLTQNLAIEPDDYLYFPPANTREVFVLGEVRLPGPVPYTPDMNIISALSARGGFTDVAYKSHVMVLRGSFSHPKIFVVNTRTILDARGFNFKLEPRDIIFVSGRPFLKGEQLLDLALSAFLQSIVTEGTGRMMGGSTF